MKRPVSQMLLKLCIISSVFAGILLGLAPGSLLATPRQALVIGNSDYIGQPLLNPRNDAIDMAAQLEALGYEVYGGGAALDLDRIGIERTIRAFARSLPDNAHALFYYAGHGIATYDNNYLIPINHNLEFQEQLPDRAVSLRSSVELLKNANPEGINIVLLDACRDNPLSRNFRSTSRGLQKLNDIPRGIFIGYAADSGQVAEDGDGRNGTYTAELLQVMKEKPDVIIEIAHKEVANRVFNKTNGKQFPVSENKVYGNWCFGRCGDNPGTESALLAQSASPKQSAGPVTATPWYRNWKVIGGAVLALVAVGAATQGDGGTESDSNFQLVISPPQ